MDILSSCYLFAGLSTRQIDNLFAISEESSVDQGAWLFYEGDSADKLYFLIEGSIELLTTIDNHIELPIMRLNSSGDCFGTGTLVDPFKYSLSSRCAEKAALVTIDREALEEHKGKDDEFSRILMTNLAKYYLSRLKEARQELKIHFKILFKTMRF